jgi:hypothetical protein
MTMKTTKGALLVLVLLGLALVPTPTAAQQERDECRCVDAEGNEIEGCHCFLTPRLDRLAAAISSFGHTPPRLGISVDPNQSASLDAEGARVTNVLEDGPAEEAGLREGDVITHVDGRPLTAPLDAEAEGDFDLDESAPVQRLLALVGDVDPGSEVEIEYLRDGERETVTVEAEELSDSWGGGFTMTGPGWDPERLHDEVRELANGARAWHFRSYEGGDDELRLRMHPDGEDMVVAPRGTVRPFGDGPGPAFWSGGLGLQLVEVNPELGAYFGAEEGVLVTHVERSSGLGLRPGDVVLRVGDRPVTSTERFWRIVGSYGAEEDIELHILRDGEETAVTGRLRY